MTEYTPAKDALLMTIVDLALSEFDDASKDYGRLAEAYRAYKAAQLLAEPKPSERVVDQFINLDIVSSEAEKLRLMLNAGDGQTDQLYAAYNALLMVLGYGMEPPSEMWREPKPSAGVSEEAIRVEKDAYRDNAGGPLAAEPNHDTGTLAEGKKEVGIGFPSGDGMDYQIDSGKLSPDKKTYTIRFKKKEQTAREEVERTAVTKDAELAALIQDNDEKMAEIERLKVELNRYNAWFDARQLFRSADEDRLDYEAKLEKVRHGHFVAKES